MKEVTGRFTFLSFFSLNPFSQITSSLLSQPQQYYYQHLSYEPQLFNITKRYKHLQNGYGSKAGNRHKGRKTRSCAKKRFNTLPDGTVVRKMTGHRHKTGWKSSRQMMRLRVTRNLVGNWAKKVKFLLNDYK